MPKALSAAEGVDGSFILSAILVVRDNGTELEHQINAKNLILIIIGK
ncbi:MAG TPA: hypothetical protein VFD55_02205 [Candidatus Angelobacter sp.]|nr:hypothetical protein [Candidatus Angelobacter sp.]